MKHQIKVRVFSVITILSMLLSAVSMPNITAQADAGWTAYNDVVYRSSDQYLGANVTTITIGTGNPGPTSGVLLDQATGASTGVTATLTQSGGVVWQPDATSGGDETAVGTDAYTTFHNITDLGGVVYYGTAGWYVDLTFTGLDPARTYTFATSANRKGGTTYADRVSRYTISDVVTAANASTSGVTIKTTSFAGDTSAFSTGENTTTGYVARWTGIQPGSDGDFTVRAQADGSVNNVYAFSVFMLREEATASTPTITTTGTLNPFTSQPGVASAEQNYTVSGSNLTDNIIITAPTDFEISLTNGSGFSSSPISLTPTSGTVASTPIYVRFNRATVGTSSGDITHVSADATTQNVAVSGTASLPPAQTLPITERSTWKYLDNGTNQGTAWKEIAFDDSSWASGPAELGYGDGGEATVVDCSAVANCNSNNYITTYFRKAFNVPDRSIYSGLNLRLLRDDGAIVYLNGTEVWRTNMPAGAVTYTTLSPTAIGGTDETTFVSPTSVLANTLVNGTNVLGVEIHQQAITSTDISFDLELTGVISTPTCYALTLGSYREWHNPNGFSHKFDWLFGGTIRRRPRS